MSYHNKPYINGKLISHNTLMTGFVDQVWWIQRQKFEQNNNFTLELKCVTDSGESSGTLRGVRHVIEQEHSNRRAGHSRSLLHRVSGRETVRLDLDGPFTLSRNERTLFWRLRAKRARLIFHMAVSLRLATLVLTAVIAYRAKTWSAWSIIRVSAGFMKGHLKGEYDAISSFA